MDNNKKTEQPRPAINFGADLCMIDVCNMLGFLRALVNSKKLNGDTNEMTARVFHLLNYGDWGDNPTEKDLEIKEVISE